VQMLSTPRILKILQSSPPVFHGTVFQRLKRDFGLFENPEVIDIVLELNADGFQPLGKFSSHSTWSFLYRILNYPEGMCTAVSLRASFPPADMQLDCLLVGVFACARLTLVRVPVCRYGRDMRRADACGGHPPCCSGPWYP
jgi:hypothetical protein